MKKVLLMFMFFVPMFIVAQNTTTEKTKYENLLSKTGAVISSINYNLGSVELKAGYSDLTYKLSFSVSKVSVGNTNAKFLTISHYELYSKDNSEAYIEYSDVKQLDTAISQLIQLSQNTIPEGATVQNTFMSADGLMLTSSDGKWRIRLERFTRDTMSFSDIAPLAEKIKEALKKMDTI